MAEFHGFSMIFREIILNFKVFNANFCGQINAKFQIISDISICQSIKFRFCYETFAKQIIYMENN